MSKLYLCATPIGNMEDITLRAVRVLGEVAAVYAEDTRHSAVLLKHLGINTPLISCHEHNETQRADEIAGRVRSGESVAFISDAGMPCISDPGARLVGAMIENGLEFEVLPGASASLTALVLSGFSAEDACFAGFLPRGGKQRRERITRLARHHGTLVIYESPLRVAQSARELCEIWGDRPAALVREITKMYEQTVRGTLNSIYDAYKDTPPRGECVLVVGGAAQKQADEAQLDVMLTGLIAKGLSAKDAAKQAAAILDLPRNAAYTRVMELRDIAAKNTL
ncbi:MAG: 16S rRNA (cytidine(1402)-2'-O)-methyltransferase [Clostridia bacterium]